MPPSIRAGSTILGLETGATGLCNSLMRLQTIIRAAANNDDICDYSKLGDSLCKTPPDFYGWK